MKEQRSAGFLISQINHVYEKDFNKRLRRLGITASQCAVLDYLFTSAKEEVTQRDIERALSLKNPTVTGLLKRLDEKGFVLIVPSNKDKRCKNVYPTEKAYDIQRRMETERKKIDKNLTLGMSRKEREALLNMLEKVLYNVSDP
ncbi:MarR family transcriptional regulator [uncultured Merdimonas sp.]|uniref:MarR family winged helix-turn-helix transcriptional regulator n=1 Tax=uncultured Merdimonas sp. TaxID=2023269 RepID=UPI00320A99A5